MRSLLLRQARQVASIVLPTPPWSPSALSPLVWLDAQTESTITKSSNVVSQWNDRGTNGNNALADNPHRPSYSASALNGLPALEVIEPSTKRMYVYPSGIGGLTNKLSVFAVASANVNSYGPLVMWGNAFGASSYGNVLYASLIEHGSSAEDVFAYRNNSFRGRKSIVRDTAHVIGSIFDGTNHAMYVDGAAGTAVASTGNFYADQFTLMGILGNFDSPASGYWRGTLGELIAIIGEVTTTDRQKVEGYLAHRWAATGNLDAGHPYKTTAP